MPSHVGVLLGGAATEDAREVRKLAECHELSCQEPQRTQNIQLQEAFQKYQQKQKTVDEPTSKYAGELRSSREPQ